MLSLCRFLLRRWRCRVRTAWSSSGWRVSGTARLAERARIVLACADSDAGNSGVAAELGLSVETVRKWRVRFTGSGTGGLADGPRPGRRKAGLV